MEGEVPAGEGGQKRSRDEKREKERAARTSAGYTELRRKRGAGLEFKVQVP